MAKNILIVDDEFDVATYLAAILESNGYSPHTASSVDQGLEMVRKVEPELICLDIMMPGESGISLYLKLKQDPSFVKIPILIISGVEQVGEFDFRSYVSDETVPPPERFLEKPIKVEEFLNVIEQLLSVDSSNSNGNQDNA